MIIYLKFENKNRNFKLLKSMNNIINNNKKIIEELNMIKDKNDKIEFLSNTFKIYEKMTDKKKIKNDNDRNLYYAIIAEKIGRYNEICNYLENSYKNRTTDFNSVERELLFNAYKNIILEQRNSLNMIIPYEIYNKFFFTYVKEYKNKIYEELKLNRNRAINFIDEYLLKRAKDDKAIVLYYKWKGDFYRYIAEYSEGYIQKQIKDCVSKAYNKAINISLKLNVLNQIRLRLFLNYSKFLYNFLDEHKKAIEIAKNVIDEVNKEFPDIDKDISKNKKIKEIYESLKENLKVWEKNERDNLEINL